MDLVWGSVAEFLTGTFLTDELFWIKPARDYHPILVENDRAPFWREMLRCEYLLEHSDRYPDYHRVDPLPVLVLNGHIDHCQPAIFKATQISALGAARLQTSRNPDTGYGTRWSVRIDILLPTIR
jgi:hypothetical protein